MTASTITAETITIRIRLAIAAAVLAAELAGCSSRALSVGAVEPSPRIDLPRQSGSLALELVGVADSFRTSSGSFPTVEVRDFHRTLRRGFERGFGGSFELGGPGRTGRTLVLEVTGLAFVSTPTRHPPPAAARDPAKGATIVLVHGVPQAPHHGTPPRRRYARLGFRATLRDGSGEIARLAAYAHSARAADATREAVGRALASAVANLYERVGHELFLRRTAALETGRR